MTIGALLGDLVALVVAVVLVGIAYQAIGSARDNRRFPPPGQMLDVGGYCLHIHSMGEVVQRWYSSPRSAVPL